MLGSTPCIMFLIWGIPNSDYAENKNILAISNTYLFSTGMLGLYFYPFLKRKSWKNAINESTLNWIIWLTCFTQIAFQIPHNIAVKQLYEWKGTIFEWPFWSYGFSDNRWCNYHKGTGLDPLVWLINWNDAIGGILVLSSFFFYKTRKNFSSLLIFVLVTLFRDSTLFRETVEYMWDHHRHGYPFTTQDKTIRIHAIIGLWMVNFLWLLAPILTPLWAYQQITNQFPKTKLE